MLNLRELQKQQNEWAEKNFGENRGDELAFYGIVEEVGELSHARIKFRQKIRGIREEEYRDREIDALGDIFIYLLDYCNLRGYDASTIIEATWNVVRRRDWVKYPYNGINQ